MCQPAAAASSVSAAIPQHAEQQDGRHRGSPTAGATAASAIIGSAPPERLREGNRQRSSRGAAVPTAAAGATHRRRRDSPSGCGNGAVDQAHLASPAPRTTLVAAASSAGSRASARMPPACSSRRAATAWSCLARSRNRALSAVILPARLIGVEEGAFELGPEAVAAGSRSAARRRARYRRASSPTGAAGSRAASARCCRRSRSNRGRAARQPLRRCSASDCCSIASSPTSSRARTPGCSAISRWTIGTTGSLAEATQKRIS